MLELLALLAAVALGCAVVYTFTDLAAARPKWAAWLLVFGAGAAAGLALTSVLFLVARLAFPALPQLPALLEAAVAAVCIWKIRRTARPTAGQAGPAPLVLPLAGALLLALVIITIALAGAWEANPQGNWDAWALWNLRARFLAAEGSLPQRAWSPDLSSTHPEYPLLTSALIARCWVLARSQSVMAPIAVSYAFFVALLALAAGGFAALRSRPLGLLLTLLIASSPVYLLEVSAQYADIALSCYIAAGMLFTLLERPVLAGVFAGCAAWTKDEGSLFLVALVLAVLLFRRRSTLRVVAGMAPAIILLAVFKTMLAFGTSSSFARSLPGAAAKLADPERYTLIASTFARQFAAMGSGWYHPAFALMVLYAALRFDRRRGRDVLFCCTLWGTVLLGYFGMYLITFFDLTWQLSTSVNRLFAQLWPAMVIAGFVGLRAPEDMAAPAARSGKSGRKARAKA